MNRQFRMYLRTIKISLSQDAHPGQGLRLKVAGQSGPKQKSLGQSLDSFQIIFIMSFCIFCGQIKFTFFIFLKSLDAFV